MVDYTLENTFSYSDINVFFSHIDFRADHLGHKHYY